MNFNGFLFIREFAQIPQYFHLTVKNPRLFNPETGFLKLFSFKPIVGYLIFSKLFLNFFVRFYVSFFLAINYTVTYVLYKISVFV